MNLESVFLSKFGKAQNVILNREDLNLFFCIKHTGPFFAELWIWLPAAHTDKMLPPCLWLPKDAACVHRGLELPGWTQGMGIRFSASQRNLPRDP